VSRSKSLAPVDAGPGAGSNWSTSSFADSTDTSPMALSTLGEHLDDCKRLNGRLFLLRCGADALHAFVTGRFVTTLVLLAAVTGIVALLL
jgi:hypothetical protein